MIRGIHHVAISTPNLERIVAFYRDVIGAEVVYEGGWEQGSEVITVDRCGKETLHS